jgi:hypothetical protein
MTSKVENRRAARAFRYLAGLCLVAIAALGPSTTAMALTKVKAGHLVALDMAPWFVGKESGCFEKAVLDVETIFFANPGDNNAALAGGIIDFSTNPFTLPFFAASSGVPIRVISGAGGWDDADVGAFGGQRPNNCAPNSACPPGNECHFATEFTQNPEPFVLRVLKFVSLLLH